MSDFIVDLAAIPEIVFNLNCVSLLICFIYEVFLIFITVVNLVPVCVQLASLKLFIVIFLLIVVFFTFCFRCGSFLFQP